MQNSVKLNNIEFNNTKKIVLIAGPCVLESFGHAKLMVEKLLDITTKLNIEFVYKTSDESVSYTSASVEYDKFKTFAVKIALTSNNAAVVPKVRDMRAIALDT